MAEQFGGASSSRPGSSSRGKRKLEGAEDEKARAKRAAVPAASLEERGYAVVGAGGVGGSCNGFFETIGTHNGKPKYKQRGGSAIIYFDSYWKINYQDNVGGWYYCVPGTASALPPTGIWTVYGYRGGDAHPPPTVSKVQAPSAKRLSSTARGLAKKNTSSSAGGSKPTAAKAAARPTLEHDAAWAVAMASEYGDCNEYMKEALEDLEAVLKVEPKSVTALQLQGELKRKLGDPQKALEHFDAALAVDPRCLAALSGRAAARRDVGQRVAALADYDLALAQEPRNAGALAGRGQVRLELGWFRDAAADFEAALQTDPRHSVAKWGFGMVARVEKEAPLRLITLSGFHRPGMNKVYQERRQPEYRVGSCETYWSLDGDHFLYRCNRESRWKGSRTCDFTHVCAGGSSGFIAGPQGVHILLPTLVRGWHEWDNHAWCFRPGAGVSSIGPLSPPLRTITLTGFERAAVNTVYMERRQPEYSAGGRETYWSIDNEHFIFWCNKEKRWKVTTTSHLEAVRSGGSAYFVAAPPCEDLLSTKRRRGWHEWYQKRLTRRSHAGVQSAGPVAPRTVRLHGFGRTAMNTKYKECRLEEFLVNDRETYMSIDGEYFLFWCNKESRWKGSSINQLSKIKSGVSSSFIGAPQGMDILSPSLLKGWHEWQRRTWTFRPSAGTCRLSVASESPEDAATRAARQRQLAAPPSEALPPPGSRTHASSKNELAGPDVKVPHKVEPKEMVEWEVDDVIDEGGEKEAQPLDGGSDTECSECSPVSEAVSEGPPTPQ